MVSLVIYNPVCGDSSGKHFTEKHVLSALNAAGRKPDAIAATERVGHAGELVLDFLRSHKEHSAIVIVASGDGTVHEIVNALYEAPDGQHLAISLVLVPVGTANALYASLFPPTAGQSTIDPAYMLQSLHAFLASPSTTKPLTVATTTISPAQTHATPRITVRTTVVTSTALHASILANSEALRAEMPGVERFKVAAHQNIARWYKASAVLLPLPSSPSNPAPLLRYDPVSKTFVPTREKALVGPFAYFLATTSVDRLEPTFEIAPLTTRLPPPGPCLEVLVLRPSRDPSYSADTPEARAAFSEKTVNVLTSAYNAGAHVDMVYANDGAIVPADAAGPDAPRTSVAEVFRCGGWEWTPESDDEGARILCADGTIFRLEPGETARCVVPAAQAEGVPRFAVYTRSAP